MSIPQELTRNINIYYQQLENDIQRQKTTFAKKTKDLFTEIRSDPKRPTHLHDIVMSTHSDIEKNRQLLQELTTQVLIASYSCSYVFMLEKELDKGPYDMVKKQKEIDEGKGGVSPFLKYEQFLLEMELGIAMVHILVFLFIFEVRDLGYVFFEILKPDLEIFPTPVNWISINKVLLKLIAVEGEIKKLGRAKEDEKWMEESEMEAILKKLLLVERFIFNDSVIRSWTKDSKAPIPIDLTQFSEHTQYLLTLVARTSWSSNDVDLDPLYLTPTEFNQLSFRNICRRALPNYNLLEITSDGNCFFRAVIKFFWENCPVLVEEDTSLVLRKLLNPIRNHKLKRKRDQEDDKQTNDKEPKKEKLEEHKTDDIPDMSNGGPGETYSDTKKGIGEEPKNTNSEKNEDTKNGIGKEIKNGEKEMNVDMDDPFEEFEEEGISDPQTMQRSGVWADHLQVMKLSAHLDNPVWLYRFDDVSIHINENGDLIPGNDYQIWQRLRENCNKEICKDLQPITLYFIPETHYEVIKKRVNGGRGHNKMELVTLLAGLDSLIALKDEQPLLVANQLIDILFLLQSDVNAVGELFGILSHVDTSVRMDIKEQLKTQNEQLISYISQSASYLDHFSESFLHTVENVGGKLHASILRPMLSEHLVFIDKKPQITSSSPEMGPLTHMLDKLCYYSNHIYDLVPLPYDEYKEMNKKNSIASYHSYANSCTAITPYTHSPYTPSTLSTPLSPSKQQYNSSPINSNSGSKQLSNSGQNGELTKEDGSLLWVDKGELKENFVNLNPNSTHALIQNPMASSAEWTTKLQNITVYIIESATVNSKSLLLMLMIAQHSTKLKKLMLERCHLDMECCIQLEKFRPTRHYDIELVKCTLEVDVDSPFVIVKP